MRKLLTVMILTLLAAAPAAAQDSDDLPWWNDRVFYEIFVRSFYDSDGDGIGDLNGIIEKLDYLNDGDPATTTDLGVTGIWLMPIMPSPSYHGYDVTDYYAVNPEYGTADDFLRLMDEAHQRGIAVIIDLVVNHTSSQHPWFLSALEEGPDSPYYDYYVWADSPAGSGWHERNGRYYYGLFWSEMPDLNYTNPEVTAAMHDIARFWLEDMGVDGFRLDAAKHIIESRGQIENTQDTIDWLADFNNHVHAVKPDALTVGEIWTTSSVIARYIPASVDLAFEFDLAENLVASARSGNEVRARIQLRRVLQQYPPGQFAPFLTNHDQNRVGSELNGDMARGKVAATLLLTAPGVPFVYYGEEVGMQGMKPDPRIRTQMPWTADAPGLGFTTAQPWSEPFQGYEAANVAAQDSDPDSLLSHYRALIHLRAAEPALRRGDTLIVDTDARAVYSILRHTADDALLIVVNLTGEPVSDYALTLEEGPLAGAVAASMVFGAGEPAAPAVEAGGFSGYRPLDTLAPYTSYIIRLSD